MAHKRTLKELGFEKLPASIEKSVEIVRSALEGASWEDGVKLLRGTHQEPPKRPERERETFGW